jgi:glucose/arabinose dehydrogenase
MQVAFDDASKPAKYDVFAEGWLEGEQFWGRPVDVQQMKDGSVLVSDDWTGAIYRIAYKR